MYPPVADDCQSAVQKVIVNNQKLSIETSAVTNQNIDNMMKAVDEVSSRIERYDGLGRNDYVIS